MTVEQQQTIRSLSSSDYRSVRDVFDGTVVSYYQTTLPISLVNWPKLNCIVHMPLLIYKTCAYVLLDVWFPVCLGIPMISRLDWAGLGHWNGLKWLLLVFQKVAIFGIYSVTSPCLHQATYLPSNFWSSEVIYNCMHSNRRVHFVFP